MCYPWALVADGLLMLLRLFRVSEERARWHASAGATASMSIVIAFILNCLRRVTLQSIATAMLSQPTPSFSSARISLEVQDSYAVLAYTCFRAASISVVCFCLMVVKAVLGIAFLAMNFPAACSTVLVVLALYCC